jgi:hypothetical protein
MRRRSRAADGLRPAGLDHARAVVRHRRHHGGERLWPAMGDGAQHAMAWVLTLPASIALAFVLFLILRQVF